MLNTEILNSISEQRQLKLTDFPYKNDELMNEIEKQIFLFNNIKEKGYYKRNINCGFLGLCGVCINSCIINCCLLRRINCEIPPIACEMINCISLDDCEKAIRGDLITEDIPKINDFSGKQRKVRTPLNKFNVNYYPILQIESKKTLSEQLKLIKKLDFPAIVISLQKLVSPVEECCIKKIYYRDLHDFLDYDGEIVLTTNIQNRYCKILMDKSENIPEMLKTLNPDVITTLDADFYLNHPTFIQLLQLDKIFKTNDQISAVNIKQIGLVPPIPEPLFGIALLSQLMKNHKTIAIPFQEFNRHRFEKRRNKLTAKQFQRRIISYCLSYYSKFKFKYILLSTSPSKGIYANSFSSMSWLSKTGDWEKREKNLKNYRRKAKIYQPESNLDKLLGEL